MNDSDKKSRLANEVRMAVSLLVVLVLVSGIEFIYEGSQKIMGPQKVIIHPASTVEIEHGNTNKQKMTFTFDGGATAQSADKILEVLAKHHVKGTFFLTGKFTQNYPDIVKKIHDGGHEIFNHTYSHPHLTTVTDEEVRFQLNTLDNMISTITGTSTRPYFRAPYGDRDERVLKIAAEEGFQSVYWTADALDWKESTGETADEVKQQIYSHIEPGGIILMHVGDTITGQILDEVFTTIENKGYKIVSLTEAVR